MNPLVTIVLPLYNVEPYFEKCINSVLEQSYKNIEIIMVDDCSTDGTLQLAQKYANKYPDIITLLRHKENKRLSAARNTAIRKAKGQWLTFVDSDDWIGQNYIKEMVEIGEKENADIVVTDYTQVYKNGRKIKMHSCGELNTDSSHREKVAYIRNMACTRMYRFSFFKEANLDFPESVWRAAELGLTIPLLTYTSKISILNNSDYFYFQRENSNSNNNKKRIDCSFIDQVYKIIYGRVKKGFEKEIEYRAIIEYIYGLTSVMIKSCYSNKEINKMLHDFECTYPYWWKNQYLERCVRGKKLIILLARYRLVNIIRLLIFLREKHKRHQQTT